MTGWLLPRAREKEPRLPHRSHQWAASRQLSAREDPARRCGSGLVGIPAESRGDRHRQRQYPKPRQLSSRCRETSVFVPGYPTLPEGLNRGLTKEHRVRRKKALLGLGWARLACSGCGCSHWKGGGGGGGDGGKRLRTPAREGGRRAPERHARRHPGTDGKAQ